MRIVEQVSSANFSTTISGDLSGRRQRYWINLEQEFKEDDPSEFADFSALQAMLAPAIMGMSAVGKLNDDCKYATTLNGTVTIRLDFFVWPSDIDLDYSLTINEGSVSGQMNTSQLRSFDVVVDGNYYAELPFIFQGGFTPQMPVYYPDGRIASGIVWTTENSTLLTTTEVHTALRGNGFAKGYKHTATINFTKEGLAGTLKIEDVTLLVTCTWLDEDNETQTKQLDLKIPDCAKAMLEFCEDGTSQGETTCGEGRCDGRDTLVIYFDACSKDDILAEKWEKK